MGRRIALDARTLEGVRHDGDGRLLSPPFVRLMFAIVTAKKWRSSTPHFYRCSAFTPGSSIPARNSSDAPPPVEMCEILSATPADLMAFSESPPPTTLTAPEAATAFASATVPLSNGGISNTPIGPFQMMVFAPAIACEYFSTV